MVKNYFLLWAVILVIIVSYQLTNSETLVYILWSSWLVGLILNSILQKDLQSFTMWSSTHMANVTFDKQVDFWEEYLDLATKSVQNLWHHWPNEKSEKFANELRDLRRSKKHLLWLTRDINERLEVFEKKLRDIWGKAHILKNEPAWPIRTKLVWENHYTQLRLITVKDDDWNDWGYFEVIYYLQEKILWISDLTDLRMKIIVSAINI